MSEHIADSQQKSLRHRLLIAGEFDWAHPWGHLALGGFIQGLRRHPELGAYEPLVVSAEPEQITRLHGVAAIADNLESVVRAAADSEAILLVGTTLGEPSDLAESPGDPGLKCLLAGQILGIKTAILGAGARKPGPATENKILSDILSGVEVLTVRDQASAMALMRAGLSAAPVVTSDTAFGIPTRLDDRPCSGRLGIAVPDPGLFGESRLAQLAEAIGRLTTRGGLIPVAIAWGDRQQPAAAQSSALGFEPVESVDLSTLPSIEAILDTLGSIDLLIGSEYYAVLGAALRRVPSLVLGDDPALAALAQQLRLGNFMIPTGRINAPAVLDAAQRILADRERIGRSLAEAVRTRSARAEENLALLAQMIETPRAPEKSQRVAAGIVPDLQPLVQEIAHLAERLFPDRRSTARRQDLPPDIRHASRTPLSAKPLVTMYICAYNAGKWIEKAVASALAQTYHNVEILIVDDGSTDDTVARVRRFNDSRINLHQIEHFGLAKVRTYAKKHFRGELIVNLDADDWIAPDLIAKQVALLQAHPEVDVTYCDYILVDAAGNPTGVDWKYADYTDPDQLAAEMFQAGCSRVPNGSMMERAEVARQVDGYDPMLKTAVDFEYLAKLAGVARGFRGVHEPLYFYRNFGGGHSGNYVARNFTVTTVLRRLWERYGGETLLGEDVGRGLSGNQRESAYLAHAGGIIFRHGETYISRGAPERFFELAAEFYREAFARDPSNIAAYTRVMQLAAMGFGRDQAPSEQGKKRRTARADSLYANQPELDVLFEDVLPMLFAENPDQVLITVVDNETACDAYSVAIEATRRGLPADKLYVHAVVPKSETTDPSRPPAFPHTAVFNDGLNHMSADTAGRFFTKLPDGHYQLDDDVARRVDITHAPITDRALAGIVGESDIVIAQTIWDAIDPEAAKALLAALIPATRPNGILFLGGYQAARHAALLEHPELEPVATRFEDVHGGWRYRRSVYGSRPEGLGPLDRRFPDWPQRFGAIFRKKVSNGPQQHEGVDLKAYWMERGKVYKNQYPAKAIATQPVPHRLVQALQAEWPASVLDYGCGFGKILREVRRVLPQARLVGLDISGSVLADGHQFLLGGPPVGLVEGDGKTIPCLSDSFDATFTHVTLIHVPHKEIRDVLRELVRVTRNTLYIGETADTAHESFYYFAHDYPALFTELGLAAQELEVPNAEHQLGARLFRVDVSKKQSREVIHHQRRPLKSHRPNNGRRLRLLVVSDRRTVHTRRFCKYFLRQGHEVHLYDTKPAWEGFEGIVQHWVDPVHYPEPDLQTQFYARVARLRDIVRTYQPDWVHGHFLIGWGWWAAMASSGVPLALTAWGSDVFLLPREAAQVQNVTRWSLRLADLITADSRALVKATKELAGGHNRVQLVPFGIDTDLFHPQVDGSSLRRRLLIPEGARVILSPRQIKPGANIETTIEAFAQVRQQVPQTFLLLKTYLTTFEQQSEYMALMRKKISDLGLWDSVRIVHDLPDDLMPALYALADVTVTVRDTDGTPCTLFESCAAGTPVIAGNIPSLAEWITDGENGLLVPVKDVEATAEAIRRVLSAGPEITRIKSQAREFAIAQGDYRRCFAHIEQAYGQRPGTPSPDHRTLQGVLGHRAKRIDILNAARADLCTAIDRGDHDHGLRVFNTLLQLLSNGNFEEVGSLVPDRMPQPVRAPDRLPEENKVSRQENSREVDTAAVRPVIAEGTYEPVGILMITHNHLAVLKRNLPLLFANTRIPYELTIVDNGSTDGTEEWLRQIDGSIPVKHELIFETTDSGMLEPTQAFFERSPCRFLVRVTPEMDFHPHWLMELYHRYEPLAESGQKCWLSRNTEAVHKSLKLKGQSHLHDRRQYALFYEEQGRDVSVTRYGQERMFHPEGNPRLNYVADCAEGNCLDIGCQYGAYTIWLAKQGHDVCAVDLGRSYLREARSRLHVEPAHVQDRVTLIQSWAERLPLAAQQFQTVYLSEILEHVIDPECTITEALRVLRPGGVLYLSVPAYADDTLEHVRQFTEESLLALLQKFADELDLRTVKWYYRQANDHFMLTLRKKTVSPSITEETTVTAAACSGTTRSCGCRPLGRRPGAAPIGCALRVPLGLASPHAGMCDLTGIHKSD